MPQYTFQFRREDGTLTTDGTGRVATVTFSEASEDYARARIVPFAKPGETAELVPDITTDPAGHARWLTSNGQAPDPDPLMTAKLDRLRNGETDPRVGR